MFVDACTPWGTGGRLKIAVVGAGISGLSAAWLLSRRHEVTVFEAEGRPGGHSHTVESPSPTGPTPVDTGFIVYNEATYPNLKALFAHLGTPSRPSEMSFAVSIGAGDLEYSGAGVAGLFAQKGNVVKLRFWSMLRDIMRFYRDAPREIAGIGLATLGEYLEAAPLRRGLSGRPSLPAGRRRLVASGQQGRGLSGRRLRRLLPESRSFAGRRPADLAHRRRRRRVYVEALCAPVADRWRLGACVRAVRRDSGGVVLHCEKGGEAEISTRS